MILWVLNAYYYEALRHTTMRPKAILALTVRLPRCQIFVTKHIGAAAVCVCVFVCVRVCACVSVCCMHLSPSLGIICLYVLMYVCACYSTHTHTHTHTHTIHHRCTSAHRLACCCASINATCNPQIGHTQNLLPPPPARPANSPLPKATLPLFSVPLCWRVWRFPFPRPLPCTPSIWLMLNREHSKVDKRTIEFRNWHL